MVSCERCGRLLTNPHSIERGFGPTCASKMGAGYGSSTWQRYPGKTVLLGSSGHGGREREDNHPIVSPTWAVNIGVNLLATSIPPVGALLTAYDVIQMSGEIVDISNQAIKTYQATGSLTKVGEKIGPRIMKMAYEQAKSQIIDSIVPGNDLPSRAANAALRSIL